MRTRKSGLLSVFGVSLAIGLALMSVQSRSLPGREVGEDEAFSLWGGKCIWYKSVSCPSSSCPGGTNDLSTKGSANFCDTTADTGCFGTCLGSGVDSNGCS